MEICTYCHRRATYQYWYQSHDQWGEDQYFYCYDHKPDGAYKLTERILEIREAIRKARKINGMLQGTMSLEGSAITDPKELREFKRRTIKEILDVT